MKTLKVLSALLSYPSPDLVAAADELRSVIDFEAVVPAAERAALHGLIDTLAVDDIYDLQERYLLLFDRTRSLSLHLFEHVHGESRDRGQAMVDLLEVYRAGGFAPTVSELPDFLPMLLEYAATRTAEEALALVGQAGPIYALLEQRLIKRSSPYAAVMQALNSLSNGKPDAAALAAALDAEPEPDPNDLEALDAAWEEEAVSFAPPGAADCGIDGLAARLRQARRPAPGVDLPRATQRGPAGPDHSNSIRSEA